MAAGRYPILLLDNGPTRGRSKGVHAPLKFQRKYADVILQRGGFRGSVPGMKIIFTYLFCKGFEDIWKKWLLVVWAGSRKGHPR
jgi:hypothetical protein